MPEVSLVLHPCASLFSRLCGGFLLLFAATAIPAATIHVGLLSYDIVAAGAPDVTAVNFVNYTGANFLAPDFPVTTALTLSDLTFTIQLAGAGAPVVIPLPGALPPGALIPPASLQFTADDDIESIAVTGVLSQTTLLLDGGAMETAISNTFGATILPSAGPYLTGGVDFALISVNTGAPTIVPEPGVAPLALLSLGAWFVWQRRRS